MNFQTYFLTEVNLFSKEPLLQAIDNLLQAVECSSPEITNWFNKQYVSWYISSKDDDKKQVTKHDYQISDPEWVKNTFDFTYFDQNTEEEIYHIIDYFNSLEEIDLKKIYKEPYEVIQKKVADWDILLKKKQLTTKNDTVENIDYKVLKSYNDGYKMVQLLSKKSYDIEGNKMGHCVGSAGYFNKKNIVILSLRDSKNDSHATLEIKNPNKIYQIKGKENSAPIKKYQPYIIDYIHEHKLIIFKDGQNIGYNEYNNSWYDPNSDEWDNVLKNKIIPAQQQAVNDILSRIKDDVIVGNVNIAHLYFTELPDLSKYKINGGFDCSLNQLTSLHGAPTEIRGNFNCSRNQITNLQGAPKKVSRNFDCSLNQLTSLHGGPKTAGGYYCSHNQLTNLHGMSKEITGSVFCSYNQLTNLQGAPTKVGKSFYCNNNQLTSLDGMPSQINSMFNCSYNPVQFTETDIITARQNSKGIIESISLDDPLSTIYESIKT
jgi:hypothetical protein